MARAILCRVMGIFAERLEILDETANSIANG